MSDPPSQSTIALIFFTFLIGYLLYECWQAYLAYSSEQWKAVTAKILEATVETVQYRNRGTTYKPKIRYQYKVGSQSYISERISFENSFYNFLSIDKAMNEYTMGDEIVVYHAPKDASQAVIKRGLRGGNIAVVIFLFIILIIAVWIVA
jgi:hypothetical protein